MIALQYWFYFSHISAWINHKCTYVHSLLNLPLTLTFSHSSRLSQSPSLSTLSHRANFYWLNINITEDADHIHEIERCLLLEENPW